MPRDGIMGRFPSRGITTQASDTRPATDGIVHPLLAGGDSEQETLSCLRILELAKGCQEILKWPSGSFPAYRIMPGGKPG